MVDMTTLGHCAKSRLTAPIFCDDPKISTFTPLFRTWSPLQKFDPKPWRPKLSRACGTLLPGKHGLYMPPQISPAGSGPLSVGASTEPSGWEWSRGLRAEPDDHRWGCEQGRVRVESMVVQELVGRDKLFYIRAVIG